ncbi:MAG: periplasmic copper-binding protein [Candidatus Peregrinibacteria bacterium GW2011_GWF2_33_10]|nr:MAG: periplasmic copper-binding protein [Candidatus Peregrinibacteria bacterium GW2011_GWF2_33_10]OGJ45760.1 MAG: hypothetical protein A2263_01150 [Candidatus Peregrinibacteria bacterium RIFOXYA2_FULL_33_21]OGJ46820.1 MAG: hypothetical protein A2272_00750 [Candidatus Peregrinibacteria bacterium RIFOXYA12_FULL_33_12]OGJ51290.1 MAG: hypothetical protein A2307_00425 [Candidatus Peregrinibacteria bacterium RIFOXYB2_FULL_33_20]
MKNTYKKILPIFISLISLFTFIYSAPFAYGADADITPPSDVEGIKAIANDQSATLTWDAATDDTGVTGYRINYGLDSVTKDGGTYMYTKDVDNVLTATVDELDNNVTYYFSITALDQAGNESEFYSMEVSATPSSAMIDQAATTSTDNQNSENIDSQDNNSLNNEDTTASTSTNDEPSETIAQPENTTDNTVDTATAQDNSTTNSESQISNEASQTNTDSNTIEATVTTTQPTEQLSTLLAPIIANFVAKVEEQNKVRVKWDVTQGADNLSDQVLYQSEDGGKQYAKGLSLGSKVREYLIANLIPGKTYTFKLTAKDLTGKETEGLVTSITLPKTGAGLAGLIAISFGIGGLISKKKK